MNTKINAWGNSLAVRIPKNILKELKLKENDIVTIEEENGSIKIHPSKKKVSLNELVSKIKADNIHSEIIIDEELGNEAW